ncbi:hypothetical protein STTU_2336 [Streptomyces sp. Tu6071]|nr:hypothetical protein STTU_2336 [Streptomyces sp. Tu6071]
MGRGGSDRYEHRHRTRPRPGRRTGEDVPVLERLFFVR